MQRVGGVVGVFCKCEARVHIQNLETIKTFQYVAMATVGIIFYFSFF